MPTEPDPPKESQDPLANITEEAKERADQVGADLDSRLADFHKRATESGARHRATKVKAASSGMTGGDSGRGLGQGLSIAYGFIGTPIVFFFVGKLIDGSNEPKWQLILGGLGAVLGFVWLLLNTSRNK